MSGSVADNIFPYSKEGTPQSGSEYGHFQVQTAFPFPKVFPLMRCLNKTTSVTLPNCPCGKFSIQNLSSTNDIRWGRNTDDEAPFIDRNYPGDSRGMIIAPRTTVDLPFLNTNVVSIAGEEFSEFQVIAYVNTVTDPIIDTEQPPEITYPVPLSTSPANGATGVSITTNIVVVMDTAMDPTTVHDGNITLVPDFACTCMLDPSDDTKIIITPNASLAFSTLYTITLTTAIRDIENHMINPAYTFSFTTAGVPDTTRPTVVSRTPLNGATGQSVTVNGTVTFSEQMAAASINNTTCRIITTSGSVNQAATVTLSTDLKTVTINPNASLAFGTSYTLRVTTGVTDLAGNALLAQSDSTFTTAAAPDTTPPTIGGRSPAANATGVAVTVTILAAFSEALLVSSVTTTTFKLTKTSTGAVIPGVASVSSSSVAVFNPSASLENSTQYTITALGGASGIKDLAGNAMVSTSVATFTTIAPSYTQVYNVSGNAWNDLDGSDILDGLKLTSSSGSGLYGKKIKKVIVTLRRQGTLGSGDNIDCKICAYDAWNTTKVSFGNKSANSITTAAAGAQYTFENATANYAMALNDCLVISQREGDGSNHISVWHSESNPYAYAIRVHSGDENNFNDETGEEFAGILYT